MPSSWHERVCDIVMPWRVAFRGVFFDLSSLTFYRAQVVLLDAMRAEVFKMEDKLEKFQKDMAKTKVTLDVTREELKVRCFAIMPVCMLWNSAIPQREQLERF